MKYQDIINLPHYEIKNNKKMNMKERAAQFMPFSALNTYEDKIEEASEIKEDRIELSEDKQIQMENIKKDLIFLNKKIINLKDIISINQ